METFRNSAHRLTFPSSSFVLWLIAIKLFRQRQLVVHLVNFQFWNQGSLAPSSTPEPISIVIRESTWLLKLLYLFPCLGFNKGVQGNKNSCYLDATLFAMFPFNSVFDSILITPYQNSVSEAERRLADDVQRILREDIVNPLRTMGFTSGAKVMKLRTTMQHLDGKLISSEMGPYRLLVQIVYFLSVIWNVVFYFQTLRSFWSCSSIRCFTWMVSWPCHLGNRNSSIKLSVRARQTTSRPSKLY